jgi:hypothetical protein
MVLTDDGRVWSNLFAVDTTRPANAIAAGSSFAAIAYRDGSVGSLYCERSCTDYNKSPRLPLGW